MKTQLSKEDVLSYMDSLRLPGAKSKFLELLALPDSKHPMHLVPSGNPQ